MKPIRRAEARNSYGPDPSLDLTQSLAHLKITAERLFDAKFSEENGTFWSPAFLFTIEVLDDGTEDGDADGLSFGDRHELKIDEDVRDILGFEDDKPLRNLKSAELSKEHRNLLLDMDNWTIRSGTKLDRLMLCLYGKRWETGQVEFNPEDLVGKEFLAKVKPKTGKKPGSYTEFESYSSLSRPKKRKNTQAEEPSTSEEELLASFPAHEAAAS